MKIKRIFVLLMLLGMLCFTSMQSASADAGGACLGQWSECRSNCADPSIPPLWRYFCYDACDRQLDSCLTPVNN